MGLRLSVLVRSASASHTLAELVSSIDHQTLPVSAFDVVFLDDGLDDRTRERLRRLCHRRPNVRLLSGPGRAQSDVTADVVIPMRTDDVLLPDAFARVVEAIADAEVVVLSRVDEPLDPSGDDAAALRSAPLAAFRSDFLQQSGLDPFAAELTAAVAEAAPRIIVLNDPALHARRRWRTQPRIDGTSLHWDGQMITLAVEDKIHVAPKERAAAARGRLVARHARSGRQFRLDSTLTLKDDGDALVLSLSSRFAPADADSALLSESGPWHLRVEIEGPETLISLPVRSAAPPSAVLGSVVVGLSDHARGLSICVGEVRGSVLRPDVHRATFHESVVGTRLTLPLPELHAVAPAATGHLIIDPIAVPAEIVQHDGVPALSAFVSGMPGRYPLSTRFGSTTETLGHDLVIDAVGGMSLSATAEVSPKKHETADRNNSRYPARRSSLAQRVRRRTPEPVARALADVPILRAAYRRLARR